MRKIIALILIACYSFTLAACFTTKDIYEDKVLTVTLNGIDIVSHRNNMGVLFYTLKSVWLNSEGKIEILEVNDNNLPLHGMINNTFPYSTYSDAVLARDEHASLVGKEYIITKKEPVGKERVFRPVATALAITIPVSVVLTAILGMLLSPPDNTQE